MKKIIFLFLCCLLATTLKAETFTSDYLKYEIISNRDATVKVIGVDDDYLFWGYAVVVPEQVEYDGVNFKVTEVERITPAPNSNVQFDDEHPCTIEVVWIGNNVTRINPDVFYGREMKKLRSIILGAGCIEVEKGWRSVFPPTIKEAYIFTSCMFPRIVKESHYNYSSGRDEVKTYDIFPSNTLEKVYVRPSLYETYRNNSGWDPYYRKIQPITNDIAQSLVNDIYEGTARNKAAAGIE